MKILFEKEKEPSIEKEAKQDRGLYPEQPGFCLS